MRLKRFAFQSFSRRRHFFLAERLADLQRLVRQRTYDDPAPIDALLFDTEQTNGFPSLILETGSYICRVRVYEKSFPRPVPAFRSCTRSGKFECKLLRRLP